MKINTLPPAKQAIRKTARYIQREFGRQSREKFLLTLKETKVLLASNPHLGPIEPLLADLPSSYRSVVVAKINKIIYRIVDDCIEIADLWDTRREPKSQANEIK